MQRTYWRCNSGHYFSSPSCPMDGWSRPYVDRLSETVKEIESRGERVSVERLREAGVEQAALDRVIVVEFGSSAAVFDGIVPEGYVIDGKFVSLEKLDRQYL